MLVVVNPKIELKLTLGLVGKIYNYIKMQLLVGLLRVAVIADLRGLFVRTKLTLTAKKKHGQVLSKKQDEGPVFFIFPILRKIRNLPNLRPWRILRNLNDFATEVAIGKFV